MVDLSTKPSISQKCAHTSGFCISEHKIVVIEYEMNTNSMILHNEWNMVDWGNVRVIKSHLDGTNKRGRKESVTLMVIYSTQCLSERQSIQVYIHMYVERGNECVLGMFVSINVHNGPKMKSIFQIKITAGLNWAFGLFRSQWDECRLHLKKSMVPTYGHLYGIQSHSFLCFVLNLIFLKRSSHRYAPLIANTDHDELTLPHIDVNWFCYIFFSLSMLFLFVFVFSWNTQP